MAKKAEIDIEIGGNLNTELGAVNKELDKLNKELDETNDLVKKFENSTKKADKVALKGLKKRQSELQKDLKVNKSRQGELKKEMGLISSLEKKMSDLQEAKKLATSVDEIKDLNAELENTQSQLDEVSDAGKSVAKEGGGAFSGMIDGAKGFFKTMMANPVLAIVSGIVLALKFVKDAFTSTEDGADTFSSGMAYLQGLLIPLKKILIEVGKFLVSMFDDPIGGLQKLGQMLVDQIVNRVMGLLQLIPKLSNALVKVFSGDFTEASKIAGDALGKIILGVEGVTEKLGDAADEAHRFGLALKDIKDRENQIEKDRRKADLKNARRLKEIEKLKNIRDDESKSLGERIDANNRLSKIIEDQVTDEIALQERLIETTRDRIALGEGNADENLLILSAQQILLEETLADLAGKKNEAITNNVGLLKEQFDAQSNLLDLDRDREVSLVNTTEALFDIESKYMDKKLAYARSKGLQENQLYKNLLQEKEKLNIEYYKKSIEDAAESNAELKSVVSQVTGGKNADLLGFIGSVDELGLTAGGKSIEPLELFLNKLITLKEEFKDLDISTEEKKKEVGERWKKEIRKLKSTGGLIEEIIGVANIKNEDIFGDLINIDEAQLKGRLANVFDIVQKQIESVTGKTDIANILNNLGIDEDEFRDKYNIVGELEDNLKKIEGYLGKELNLKLEIEKERLTASSMLMQKTGQLIIEQITKDEKKAIKITESSSRDRVKNKKQELKDLKKVYEDNKKSLKLVEVDDTTLTNAEKESQRLTTLILEENKKRSDALVIMQGNFRKSKRDAAKEEFDRLEYNIKLYRNQQNAANEVVQRESRKHYEALEANGKNFQDSQIANEAAFNRGKTAINEKYSTENIKTKGEIEDDAVKQRKAVTKKTTDEILLNEQQFASTSLKLWVDYLKKREDATVESTENIILTTKRELERLKALNEKFISDNDVLWSSLNATIDNIFDPTSILAFQDAVTNMVKNLNKDLKDLSIGAVIESAVTASATAGNMAFSQARQNRQIAKEEEIADTADLYADLETLNDERLKQGLITEEAHYNETEKLEHKALEEKNDIAEGQFKAQRDNDFAQAMMNGAVAITQGFAQLGPIGGAISAAMLVGVTATQGAMIKNQEYAPMRASRGGVVEGNGAGNVDSVNALLAPGETVINSQSSGMFGGLLSAINVMGNGKELQSVLPPPVTMFDKSNSNQDSMRAYVVESDISKTQNYVRGMEKDSEY